MTSIGFTAESIALVVIIMGVTTLFLEIPFGFVADRWSRKGVLILANLVLALASLLLGLADNVMSYTFISILYGVYVAMFSGTIDSIVYDTLLEENNDRDGYEKYYGYTNLLISAGLVIGSLIGGLVAEAYSLSTTYIVSAIPIVAGGIVLMLLNEPKLHKHQAETEMIKHIKETFKLVLQRGTVAWIILALVGAAILLEVLYEMDQLWLITLNMDLQWYGPVNAMLLLGYGLGGPLAGVIVKRRRYIVLTSLLMIATTVVLHVESLFVSIAALTLGILLYETIYTVGLGKLHDLVPSKYRSGAASAVSTLGSLAMIPVIYAFGFMAENSGVFTATYLLIPFAIITVVSLLIIIYRTPVKSST